jgi:hypothetical protein
MYVGEECSYLRSRFPMDSILTWGDRQNFQRDHTQQKSRNIGLTSDRRQVSHSMPSPLASAFLPLLVLFPIYITLNITFLGEYSWCWLLLSLACGKFPKLFSGLTCRDVVHIRCDANFLWRVQWTGETE